jgi:predicted DNA-binding transcriptional regulator AlpA
MALADPEDKMIVQLSVSQLRQIIAEEVANALQIGPGHTIEEDNLLTPEQAAEILGQSVRWLYRHAAKLPFTRRLSRKNLRFSEAGLRRWIAAKKPAPTR